MPLTYTLKSAGGTNYATLGMFVGPMNHTAQIVLDVSTLTSNEVDANGYLKPGVPLNRQGDRIVDGVFQKFFAAAGGAAGAITVTGITTLDQLLRVYDVEDPADLTDEFTISDADEIDNTGGTATTGDTLNVEWLSSLASVFGVNLEPVKVAADNAAGTLAAADDLEIAVGIRGDLNKHVVEDNLGRALTAAEVQAFLSPLCFLKLLS